MIELLIKIVEKLTELLKISYSKEMGRFDKVIQPLYENLETIHRDYVTMFLHAKQNLLKSSFTETIELFESESTETRYLRRSTRELADTLVTVKKLKKYHNFFVAVSTYLNGPFAHSDFSPSLGFLDELRGTHSKQSNILNSDAERQAREYLVKSIDNMIVLFEARWNNVTVEYGKLLAQTL